MSKQKSNIGKSGFWKQEPRTVEALDKKEEFLRSLTKDELHALRIVLGIKRPDSRHSRKWACRTMAGVNQGRMLGMLTLWIMRTKDIRDFEQYLDYFLPKAERQDKLLVSGDKEGSPLQISIQEAEDIFRSMLTHVEGKTRGLPGPHERVGEPGLEAE